MIQINKTDDIKQISKIIHNYCIELEVGDNCEKLMLTRINLYDNFIAVKDDLVVGGCGITKGEAINLVEYLWVEHGFRGKNIGGLLGRKIINSSKNKQVRIVIDKEKLPLYEKLKFKTIYYVLER